MGSSTQIQSLRRGGGFVAVTVVGIGNIAKRYGPEPSAELKEFSATAGLERMLPGYLVGSARAAECTAS